MLSLFLSIARDYPELRPVILERRKTKELSRLALARFANKAQRATGLGGEVNILLTGDAEMQRLNLQFRRKDKPTDVLSFPAACACGRQRSVTRLSRRRRHRHLPCRGARPGRRSGPRSAHRSEGADPPWNAAPGRARPRARSRRDAPPGAEAARRTRSHRRPHRADPGSARRTGKSIRQPGGSPAARARRP